MGAPADHPWCAAGIGAGVALGYSVGRRSGRERRTGRPRRNRSGSAPYSVRPKHAAVSKRGSPTMRSWPGWRSAAQRERRKDEPPRE
jgi:hypothetical protein